MQEVISFIKQKLLEEYQEAIELIIVYGSYARGTYDEYSDIDMIVLVNAEKRYSGITSLPWIYRYKNVSIDCWESIWSQQEEKIEIIKNNIWLFTIGGTLDCEILYYRDEKTLSKFKVLQNNIEQIILNEQENMRLLDKHYDLSSSYYAILKAQKKGDLLSARMNIWGTIFHMITALARLNGTYYKYNWGKNLSESFSLKLLPVNFKARIKFLVQTSDISEALDNILALDEEIRIMIEDKTAKILQPEKEKRDLDEMHIGMIEYLNKMRSACKNQDLANLSYIATELQLMTAEQIALLEGTIDKGAHYVPFSITRKDYLQQGLPDFSALITKGDIAEIAEAVEIFESKVDTYMKEKSSLYNITDFSDLKEEIANRINSMKKS
ncbi:MAG: nucleotidyltransferase domain-containing protein [Candidatus Heimdallarchaeaceae archaeon]